MKKFSVLLLLALFLISTCSSLNQEAEQETNTETTDTPEITPAYNKPSPEPTLTPTPLPIFEIGDFLVSDKDEMTMMYVPGGEFEMGYEDTAHIVYLDAFWIDKTEVTNAQYLICVQDGSCMPPGSEEFGDSRYLNWPVTSIDWYEANNYCTWAGRRLPTEAEWEKAARGTDGRIYPWGNDEPNTNLLNYNGNIGHLVNVGSYPEGASPYGVLDMAGSLYEWCWDFQNEYDYQDTNNPRGFEFGVNRSLRGGCYVCPAKYARSVNRSGFFPFDNAHNGIRCATSQPFITMNKVVQGTNTLQENTSYLDSSFEPITPAKSLPLSGLTPESFQISNIDGIKQLFIPASEFEMGITGGPFSWEEPSHFVFIHAFWIDQTEITNNQYKLCVEAGKCNKPNSVSFFDDPAYVNYPVVGVTWYDANNYCHWTGRRLPTEAEWEKAARGKDKRTYPWGEENPDKNLANCNKFFNGPVEVGSFPQGASPYGVLDMSGNVYEWVWDWFDWFYYKKSEADNPTGPLWFEIQRQGSYRSARGGAWFSQDIRTTHRYAFPPNHFNQYTGFRCAQTIEITTNQPDMSLSGE